MFHRTSGLFASFCALLLLGVSAPGIGYDGYWLKDAPVGRMTKQDFDIANPVVHRALDEGRDGQVYEWNNPGTGASGSVKLLSEPFVRKDMTCRRAQFTVSAGGLRNVSTWMLCKLPDGWKAVDG
jgi:surface antigen